MPAPSSTFERLSNFGVRVCEAWKAWRTFNWDIFLIIVKWRKGGKSFHDYQKYIPIKYAKLFKPRTLAPQTWRSYFRRVGKFPRSLSPYRSTAVKHNTLITHYVIRNFSWWGCWRSVGIFALTTPFYVHKTRKSQLRAIWGPIFRYLAGRSWDGLSTSCRRQFLIHI